MKNNKTKYIVNKQEDEDVEAFLLHPENAIADTKREMPEQFTVGSKENIKHKASGNQIKNLNRFT